MALAKNLGTPRERAEQNHPLRTNRPRRISGLRSSLPQLAQRSCLDATGSRRTFVAQAAALFAACKILRPQYRPESLMLAKSLIISTCGDQHPQLLHNQHLQIPNCKPRRINTCRKRGRGERHVLTPFSRAWARSDRSCGQTAAATDLVSKRLIMCRRAHQKTVRISHLIHRQRA